VHINLIELQIPLQLILCALNWFFVIGNMKTNKQTNKQKNQNKANTMYFFLLNWKALIDDSSKIVTSNKSYHCNCHLGGEVDSWCFLLCHVPSIFSQVFFSSLWTYFLFLLNTQRCDSQVTYQCIFHFITNFLKLFQSRWTTLYFN